MRLGTLRTPGGEVPVLVGTSAAATVAELSARVGPSVELGGVIDLLATWDEHLPMLRAAEAVLDAALDAGNVTTHPIERLGPPISRPGKVIAIGRNYAAHAAETGNAAPPEPMIFTKHATAVVGPTDDIVRPWFVADLDYEAELAVVIGRRCRDVSESAALEHVAGYCCANDVSARAAQHATGQFVRGKSFDTFCPMGPFLVTADEVPDPQALDIECRVDGEVRQHASTADMIFSVARLVSHCSNATSLEPGDVILTGTPAGVALGRTPPPWLQPGQLCEVEISGIGRLANRVSEGMRPG